MMRRRKAMGGQHDKDEENQQEETHDEEEENQVEVDEKEHTQEHHKGVPPGQRYKTFQEDEKGRSIQKKVKLAAGQKKSLHPTNLKTEIGMKSGQ